MRAMVKPMGVSAVGLRRGWMRHCELRAATQESAHRESAKAKSTENVLIINKKERVFEIV